MRISNHARGGAPVAVLSRLDTWEANLVLNFRLWSEGEDGRRQVWAEYKRALSTSQANEECKTFDYFLSTVFTCSHRPLVRHEISCSCVGSDESVLLNMVRLASDGHLTDAALVATLLSGPAHAERIALLAGQVGQCVRRIAGEKTARAPRTASNVVRLH